MALLRVENLKMTLCRMQSWHTSFTMTRSRLRISLTAEGDTQKVEAASKPAVSNSFFMIGTTDANCIHVY